MTKRKFFVAGTNLTVPWEVFERTWAGYANQWPKMERPLTCKQITEAWGFTEKELDLWYGKHWREVAE